MNRPNRILPAEYAHRPLAMKLLLLACALAVPSCRDEQGAGSQSQTETRALPEEPSGVTGVDEREGTVEDRRPSEGPGIATGGTDQREDQVLHGDDGNPDSQGPFPTWSLSDEPHVVIGGADEREGYLLHRVAAATRLGDGRIVVANGGSLELRYYDSEGSHLLSAGGEGEGPGELTPPLDHFTRLAGDSILVASWRSGFIRFGPDGGYASSIPYELPPRGRCWEFEGNDLLPDGSLLLRYSGISRFADTDEPCSRSSAVRPPVVFGRYMPGTATGIDTIAVMPGFERTGSPYDLYAYAEDLVFGVAFDRLYLGDTGSDAILVMSFLGDTIGTVPVPFEPAPVPADAREKAFEDVTVTGLDPTSMEPRARTERTTFVYSDHYPRYARLVADPHDRVWVMAYPPLRNPAFPHELTHTTVARRLDEGALWRVVDQDGVIGELRTPPGFFLLEVGDDYVLGLHKDELQRESVRLYRLVR